MSQQQTKEQQNNLWFSFIADYLAILYVIVFQRFIWHGKFWNKKKTNWGLHETRQDQGQTFRVKIKYWCSVTLQTVRIEETTSKMNIEVYFNAISYQIPLLTMAKSFHIIQTHKRIDLTRRIDHLINWIHFFVMDINIYIFCRKPLEAKSLVCVSEVLYWDSAVGKSYIFVVDIKWGYCQARAPYP